MISWIGAARRVHVAQILTVVLVSSMVVGALPFAPVQPAAAAPGVGQTYYTPFEAQDFIDTLRAIQPGGSCCTGPVVSTISLTSSANGNTVIYDHFEDGYEADPSSPVQASTVTLSLDAGDVWTQTSNVPVDAPGRGAGNFFDGRDKIVVTRPIAVVQAAYTATPGTLHAGAVSAYDINKFGRRFDIPVGENANYNRVFDHVGAIIVGSQPGTTVQLDADNNGTFESSLVIGVGETAVVNSGMSLGARVEADKPVGVYVSTGDNSAMYEGRFFELFPTETWASSYVTPVGSQNGTTGATRAFLYNPGLNPVTVNRTGGGGSTGTIALPPQGTGSYQLPVNQGALFASDDGSPFYVVQLVTTESTATSAYDWGFTLVPSDVLAPSFVVPYGPGSAGLTRNYSPVWVSALADTTLFVDLDGDPATGTPDVNGWGYDFTCAVSAFQSWTIYDDGTNTCIRPGQNSNTTAGPKDLTGARIYTNDGTKLTAAWGQRPNYTGGSPALDMGTTIFPNPAVEVLKDATLSNDLDGDGELDPGETLTYAITATNYGIVDVLSVVVTDETPVNTSYLPGSTTINGSGAPDDAGPFSPSPLDLDSPSSGLPIGTVLVDGTVTVTFDVIVDDPLPFGVLSVENAAVMSTSVGLFTATDSTLFDGEPLQIRKSSVPSSTPLQGGDSVDYTIEVFNADTVDQTVLVVNDALPSGTTYRTGSATADIDGTGIPVATPPTFVSGETLQPGELLTITFTVDVDGPIPAGLTDYTNVATAQSDQRGPSSAQVTDPADPRADLAVTKADSPDPQRAGNQVTYSIEVENLGPDEAASVSVVDILPAGVTFNATVPGGLCTEAPAGTLTCDLGDLTVGTTSFDVIVDVDAATAGTITNSATVGSATADPVPANNTDDEDTLILNPSLLVTKSTSTPVIDSGDTASYSYAVDNTGTEGFAFPAALSITDDSCAPVTGPIAGDTNGNSILDPAETWTFTCATALTQDTTNTVTVTATPAIGPVVVDTDQAVVDVRPTIAVTKGAGVASVDESGGVVVFTITVENTGLEDVTIDAINDSVFGDVLDPGNAAILATTCAAGTTVVPGAGNAYSCTFDANVTGNASGPAHTNTVTVDASDNEGNTVQDADGASVGFNDVVPTLTVTKSAGVGSILEPGGVVTFTVDVENTGPESVDLTALADSDFGDLFAAAATTCAPTTIAPASSYSCAFDGVVSGTAAGPDHSNTVTATVEDDEGNVVDGADTATVVINDVAPSIVVSKVPSVSDVDEPGGAVSFTVSVENVGVEDVDVTAIDDSVFGDVLDPGNGLMTGTTCAAVTVAPGAGNVYSCTFSVDLVVSAVDSPHVNTVDVTAADDEGNVVTESAVASIVINDVVPTLTVTKTPTPGAMDEPGATVSFAITVTNDSTFEPVDLTGLADDVFGDLTAATATTCVLPQVLAPGGSYACSFSGDISDSAANSPHQNTVTATGTDDEGSLVTGDGTAGVVINDVAPSIVVSKVPSVSDVDEPGGAVSFTVSVENVGVEDVDVTAIDDSVFGDVLDPGNGLMTGTTCAAVTVAPGAGNVYSCTFSVDLVVSAVDSPHVNTVDVTAADDEGNVVTESAVASIVINDVVPTLTVTKTPTPGAMDEPGATVSFAITVTNDSTFEPVDLTGLADDVFGDLTAATATTCVLPQVLAPGGSYACSFSGDISDSAANSPHQNTVTATGTDDEGSLVTGDGTAGVVINDVAPSIVVSKSASPLVVPAVGEPVTFTVSVENTGVEPISLTTLTDDIYGDIADALNPLLDGTTCTLPQVVALAGTYSCTFTATPSGAPGTTETDTVTAEVIDDEGTTVTGADSATVTFGGAEISGLAWLDGLPPSGNGVQDAGEAPVAGLTVDLLDDLGAVIATTSTDGAGGYLFDGLDAGDYRVRVTPPAGGSFVVQDAGGDDTVDSDVDGTGVTALIALASGEVRDDVDAGVRPASLTDTVWLDLDADGTRTAGEDGIPGITVILLDDLGGAVATTTTDASGGYTFDGLAPGDYSVLVDYPGAVFSPLGPDSDVDAGGQTPSPFPLVSGPNVDRGDAGVTPTLIGNFVWLDGDADGVQGAGEPGVGGAPVQLYDGLGALVQTTTTDPSGAYQFAVTPGDYRVAIGGGGLGFSPQDAGADDTIDSDVDGAGSTAIFPAPSGVDDDSADAGVLPAGLVDSVWLDLNGDGVQDPGEPGIEGVAVNLYDTLGSLLASTTTDPAGQFVFNGLLPGDYEVEVAPVFPGTGFVPAGQGSDPLLDSDVDPTSGRVPITTSSGLNTGLADAGVVPGALTDTVWLDLDRDGLHGADEPGVAGVTVNLFDALGAPIATSMTDGSGRYTFPSLIPADYEIDVVAPSGGAFTVNNVGPDESIDSDVDPSSGLVTVAVPSGLTVDESAAGLLPGSIAGTLWFDGDADTVQGLGEAGMAGITVQLLDDLGSPVSTTVTIGDGSYVFAGLAPGDYTVRVDAATIPPLTSQTFDLDGLLDDETVVAVGLSDDVAGVDFGYQAPASVGGVVFEDTDGDGLFEPGESALAGVDVTITDSVGNVFVVTTATDGGYSSPVQPGPITADVVESTLPSGVVLTTANEPQAVVAAASTTSTFTAIGYQPFYPVSGVVWDDANGDGTQDPGEAAVTGVGIAGVCAGPDGTLGTGDDVDLGTQTTAGSFTFPAVPVGDCSFTVDTSTLPAGLTLPTFDPGGGDDGVAIVSVPVGGRTDVDFGYVPGMVDLYLTKVSTEGNVQAGDEAEWILTVANIGPAGATGPITVTDDLPDGLSYVSSSGAGWSCSAAGSLVTCEHPGPLPAGGSLELGIVTDVDGDLSGTVNNFAEVTLVGDANVLNNLAFAGIGLLPATGFNLTDALAWSLVSLLLGFGLVLLSGRRDDDQDLVRNS